MIHITKNNSKVFESHKIYKYNAINFNNFNYLLRNGFQINSFDSGHVYISNDGLQWINQETDKRVRLFSIDIHIFYLDNEIHCSKYINLKNWYKVNKNAQKI